MNFLYLFLAGAAGALIKEIVEDNALTLPKKIDGKFGLGFLGSLIIGGFAGYAIDGSLITAAMAGFTGFAVIENLIQRKTGEVIPEKTVIAAMVRVIARAEGVDPELAAKVAACESGLDCKAVHVNLDLNPDGSKPKYYGSKDRGVFQINDMAHPEVTDEQAFDIAFSTKFFCRAFKEGHLSWWDATKKCWQA